MSKTLEKNLDFDPEKVKTFADLTRNLSGKAAPEIRKRGFENYLKNNDYQVFEYKEGNIYVIQGAKYNDTEFHIALICQFFQGIHKFVAGRTLFSTLNQIKTTY